MRLRPANKRNDAGARTLALVLAAATIVLGLASLLVVVRPGEVRPSGLNSSMVANRESPTISPAASPLLTTNAPSPTATAAETASAGPSATPTTPPSPSPVATPTRPQPTTPPLRTSPPGPTGPEPSTLGCDPSLVPGASTVPPVAPVTGAHLHVPILMYHRIIPFAEAGNSLHGLVVPPETFEAQMKYLIDRGWHAITMRQLGDALVRGVAPAAKTFVATFDDGYDDGYVYALPIMRRLGITGTFYVIAGRIDSPGDLTAGHIQELVAAGNDIGNHSMNHVDVTTLSQASLRYEIWTASERIARVAGQWPASFAYPFGTFNAAAERELAKCMPIRLAVTTAAGASETWTSRFEAPRVRVNPETTPQALLAALQPFA